MNANEPSECSPKRFWRDASNRLTYDAHISEADRYPELLRVIADRFGLKNCGDLVTGVAGATELILQEYELDGVPISIEWDNWTGFTVVAETPAAEELVRQIGMFLDSYLHPSP